MHCPNFENYSPCECSNRLMGHWVTCENLPTEKIRSLFHEVLPGSISVLSLSFKTDPVDDLVILPSNLLSSHTIQHLKLSCPSKNRLQIDPNVFYSSTSYIRSLEISKCDMNQVDFSFMKGFSELRELTISNTANIDLAQWEELWVSNITEAADMFTVPSTTDGFLGKLWRLDLSCNKMSDSTTSRILEGVLKSSNDSLTILYLNQNKLSRIPKELSSFKILRYLDCSGQQSPDGFLITTGSLLFSLVPYENTFLNLILHSNNIRRIETGAFRGIG